MNVSFSTRPKAEIDDLVAFFEGLGGVTKFEMTIDDSNGDETIKVTCKSWSQTWAYDNFYSLSATFQRCYEA
jgi:phage-related protein